LDQILVNFVSPYLVSIDKNTAIEIPNPMNFDKKGQTPVEFLPDWDCFALIWYGVWAFSSLHPTQ
jgi:hypothetical protein